MRVCRRVIAAGLVSAGLGVYAQQGFYREFYAGIEGNAVSALTNAPVFPNAPTVEEVVNGPLETGTNIADYYGHRVRALLTPTVTGNYTFWIACDDNGELWLGTNATPATRRRIAHVSSWTNARQWDKEANQKSALIALTAGTTYYIEALQKENAGGDNLSVAWQVPGTTATNVIPAAVIQPYLEPPAIKTQPVFVQVYAQWEGVERVTFSIEPVRKGGMAYQWTRNGVDISGATQPSYTLVADAANAGALYRCRLTSLGGTVTSAAASYAFVPDTVPPALAAWRVYHDARRLVLEFSEPLALPGATNRAAYAVSGRTVAGAELLDDRKTVVLTLDPPLAAGASHTLSLAVTDCATPANPLNLSGFAFTPALPLPVPGTLLRPAPEPPGPSSRRSCLAVTEINHSPATRGDGRDIRFVEIYNANPYPLEIGGFRFSGAFDYTVPPETVLAANAYLAVAPAPADVAAVYGIGNVIGGFAAAAFDGSSEITVNDEIGAWITTVAYSDDPPWPVAADGSGHTLVLARPSYGEREADGWAASARRGGSPGTAEPARDTTYDGIVLNEVLTHAGATPGFVELYNASSVTVSLAGCVLKRGNPDSAGYTIPAGTVLASRGFFAADETVLGFKLNGTGGRLWLFAPESAGGFAIDATRLANQEAGVAFGRTPDGAALWNRLESPTPAAANASRRAAAVVLNEIMYHPISDKRDDEYVELHNPGAESVDLTGWRLGGSNIAYDFTETIPAGGYLIVPRSRSKLAQLYPDRVGQMTTGGFSGALVNSRDTVTLSRPAWVMNTDDPASPVLEQKRVVIETVTYRDGGEWGALADGGGSSLERIDPRTDPQLARSWAASDETQKSAWTTLEFTGKIDHGFTASANGDPTEMHIGLMNAGECLIDSVEVRAAGGANLVNNPSFEEDTADWRFMGTHDRSSLAVAADAYDGQRVLHVRAVGRVQTGMNVIRGAMSAMLPKSGTGTIRARVRWLSGSPELLIRTRGNWLEASGPILTTLALGTPGQPNSRARANGAPALFDVIHQPVLPRNGQKVTVYARAADPDGLSRATLYYRVDGTAGTNAVAMTACAGGYLAGEIPAGQPNNALVAFWVEAADGRSPTGVSRFPADAPQRECLVRFNEPIVGRAFGIYRFWMTQDNVAYWTTREKASNGGVDATFIYGDSRVIYHAGMMYAGSPFHSSYASPINPGANIDYEALFPDDDKVLDDDGMVLSTVGNLGNDTIAVREHFCYALVKSLGLPNMYRRFVHLYANGTEQNPKKIFEDTEKPNASVLKHWYPEAPENDFFKIDDWFEYTLDITTFSYVTARLQKYLTDAPDGDGQALKLGRYRWNWQKRGYENFKANDYTNFFSLVETLNLTDPETYTRRIQEEMDVKTFARVIAMNQFIGNFDSYGFNRGKNMYLYDSAAGWALIAWDLDFNFGANRPLNDPIIPTLASFPTEDPTMRTFLKHPVVARHFLRAADRLTAVAQDPALRALTRAKYDALMADGTSLTGSYEAFFTNVEIRATNVIAQLAAANPPAFAVTDPAAEVSSATQNTVTVTGVAPFGVTAVRINGVEVPITWTTVSNWTAQVVLNNGANLFQVQAFTEDGAALSGGSAVRSITYTGVPLDPMERFLVFSEVMASPATNGAAYVELLNRSATTVMNLTGVYLDGAVRFAFPNGAVLQPGGIAVVAQNSAAFSAAYGADAAARVAGVYSGTLDPAGDTLLLKRQAAAYELDDPVVDRLVYEGAYPWPSAVPAGASLQLINPAHEDNRVGNWAAETNLTVAVTNTPVPWGATWRYFNTAYPGDTWAEPAFNDSAWPSGPGPLGYEVNALPIPLATTFPLTGRMAYYFRMSFTFAGNPENTALALTYMLDDGAVFYLNGQEIHRSSLMPLGTITDTTAATTAKQPEGQIEGPFALPATALRGGANTLAVRVHQNQVGSSDLVFGMKLELVSTLAGTASPGAASAVNVTLSALPDVWLNEIQPRNVSGPADNLGAREPWVELYNSGTTSVSLAGWTLARAADDPGWGFPAGTTLAAGGFLRVWLDGAPDESAAGHLHAGFRLEDGDGLLVLRAVIDGRAVTVDYLRFADAAADAVWGAYPDGASNPRRWLNPATPAAPNRTDKPAARLVINEFMAQNDLFTNPLSGKKDDWFELFNDGTETVDLGGYVVTDTLTSETPPVPDLRASKALVIPAGVTLAPGHALRIWTGATNAGSLPFDPAHLQAPFGLAKDADQICLFDPSLALADRLVYASPQSGTASMGRWLNGAAGELVTFAAPTPGQPNRNPRFAAALAQPALQLVPEEAPFAFTPAFLGTPPASVSFRCYPLDAAAVPEGLAMDEADGRVTWTPTEEQGPGFCALRVCGFVEEGLSVVPFDEILLTLKVLEVNRPPVRVSAAAYELWQGEPFAAALRYEDPDLPPNRITYSLLSGPAGLTVDGETGRVAWQPQAGQTGTFTLDVRVSDNAGAEEEATVTVVVDTARLHAGGFAAAEGGGMRLQWPSKPGAAYVVEWCADLGGGAWVPLNAATPLAGTGGALEYTVVPSALGSPANAFFRVRQVRE